MSLSKIDKKQREVNRTSTVPLQLSQGAANKL